VSTQSGKPVVTIAVGGFDGGLTELMLAELFQEVIGNQLSLKLVEFAYADDLLEAARREAVDLFIVFFNPIFKSSPPSAAENRSFDLEGLRRLKSAYRKPVLVVKNAHAGYSADSLLQAGADAVFGMPFAYDELRDTAKACLSAPPKA
jgi:hypothetical protein